MRRNSLLVPILVGSFWAARAQTEQPKVATGLWELEVSSHMSGAGLPPAMAGMPARVTKVHSCATKENIAETFASAQQRQQGKCTRSNLQTSATQLSVDFSCNDGETTGHVEVVFDSDSSAHSTMHATTNMRGTAIQMDSSTTAKRISADCGSVKPGEAQVVH